MQLQLQKTPSIANRESATPSHWNTPGCKNATSSQSEITSEYDASSEPSSREALSLSIGRE